MRGMHKKRRGSIPLVICALVVLMITTSCSLNFLAQSDPSNPSNHIVSVAALDVSALPEGQGLFESCSPIENPHCDDRLKQMAAAGFKLVINYQQLEAHSSQIIDYAEQAHLLGIKIIWAMNSPAFWNGSNLVSVYKPLASSCDCSDNQGFTSYFISLVRNLPATWGYLLGDGVSPRDHDKIKTFADSIKQLDPYHPRLILSNENAKSSGANIKPFVDASDVIGSSVYTIGNSESPATVGKVASSLQSIANRNGKQTVLVLQSFSAAQYGACAPPPGCARFPTKDEMRQMLEQAMEKSHPRFILWFSYFDILRSDNPSMYWTNLVQAAGVSPINAGS